jgi:zinc protease
MRSAALLAVSLAIAALARADGVPPRGGFDAQTVSLANGLRVVLAPDPSVSALVVHVRYEDGAGTETDATSGFTYLVERLFAHGTVHTQPGEHRARIDDAGGFATSATSIGDLTLTTQVPRGALELALWLEAERMAGLADGLTERGLAAARAEVLAERRSAYVDQPHALVERAVREALWPAGDPRRRDVLGDGDAINAATLDDVRRFVRARIRPDRATLVIAGAFDATTARQLVHRYFGWIPGTRTTSTTPLAAVLAPPMLDSRGHQTIRIADRVRRVVVAARAPVLSDDQHGAALCEVLANGRSSRLHRALVDSGLASAVRADLVDGRLEIEVAPAPGSDLLRIARVALAELALPPAAHVALASELEHAWPAAELRRLIALENLPARARLLALHPNAALSARRQPARGRRGPLSGELRTWLSTLATVTVIAGEDAP